ncbi:hypothetical protein LTS18_004686, partial [Coniosporium uncinatum]
MKFQRVSLLSLLIPAVVAYQPCPLLGPTFEQPAKVQRSRVFQDAARNLTSILNEAVRAGHTSYGPLSSNLTSFSVGVFDASSPFALFSYQHTASTLRNSTQGVQAVTEDSVYRIGSLSKLITAYIFLLAAGPKYWEYPVTKFLPELREAAKNCSAKSRAVDCIDWTHVTLGALASHMAGIPRD